MNRTHYFIVDILVKISHSRYTYIYKDISLSIILSLPPAFSSFPHQVYQYFTTKIKLIPTL